MDAESMQKTFKSFNFTTTNAILMKLIIDIDLNKVFHLPKSWGVRVEESINQKTHKMSQIVFWPNFDYFLILQQKA